MEPRAPRVEVDNLINSVTFLVCVSVSSVLQDFLRVQFALLAFGAGVQNNLTEKVFKGIEYCLLH